MTKPWFIAWSYCAYVIFWESFIFGGTGYAVFLLKASGWWFFAAICISSCNWRPERWHSLLDGVWTPPKE